MAKKKNDLENLNFADFFDDDDDDYEWVNFDEPTSMDLVNIEPDDKILYCKIDYESLQNDYKNSWNKIQPRVLVQKIYNPHCQFSNPPIIKEKEWLGLGKRLYKQVKSAALSNWIMVKILKRGTKYDTQYYIREYVPKIQLKIDDFIPEF